jgi:uncharacterized surface protein with fasciclin (FAS1) repeats
MAKPLNSADLIAAARAAGEFETFLAAVERAGLSGLLQGPARYTVFAPTDEAFAKLSSDEAAKLSAPGKLLTAVVSIHLVAGEVRAARLAGRRIRGKSVEGGELVITGAKAIDVNGAIVVRPDILAANGVLHGIDRLLWPKLAQRAPKPAPVS